MTRIPVEVAAKMAPTQEYTGVIFLRGSHLSCHFLWKNPRTFQSAFNDKNSSKGRMFWLNRWTAELSGIHFRKIFINYVEIWLVDASAKRYNNKKGIISDLPYIFDGEWIFQNISVLFDFVTFKFNSSKISCNRSFFYSKYEIRTFGRNSEGPN